MLCCLGYEKDNHQNNGKSGKKRRWRPSSASHRRTTPEAGQTSASESDPGEASQVSIPFHQKDQNQGEHVAAAAVVGKTTERAERRGNHISPLNRKTPFYALTVSQYRRWFSPRKAGPELNFSKHLFRHVLQAVLQTPEMLTNEQIPAGGS